MAGSDISGKSKRGGFREGSGRTPGAKNKRTLERETREKLEAEAKEKIAELAEEDRAVVKVATRGKKLAKDVLRELMELSVGMAALYQPAHPDAVSKNRHEDPAKFQEWFAIAAQTAKDLAPYESPRYSAVMVGAAVVTKVTVEGGMPDEFAAPPKEIEGELVPGATYSVEDDRVTRAA